MLPTPGLEGPFGLSWCVTHQVVLKKTTCSRLQMQLLFLIKFHQWISNLFVLTLKGWAQAPYNAHLVQLLVFIMLFTHSSPKVCDNMWESEHRLTFKSKVLPTGSALPTTIYLSLSCCFIVRFTLTCDDPKVDPSFWQGRLWIELKRLTLSH